MCIRDSLDITGYNTQIGSITGGGTAGGNVILGAATLTMGGDNSSPAAYAGVISGVGGITKIGTGTQLLTGANTYSGNTTTINGGTLQVGNSSALGTGPVINNATLDIGSTTLNIGGAYTQGSAATLKVAINGSSSGSIETKGSATVIQGDSLSLIHISEPTRPY